MWGALCRQKLLLTPAPLYDEFDLQYTIRSFSEGVLFGCDIIRSFCYLICHFNLIMKFTLLNNTKIIKHKNGHYKNTSKKDHQLQVNIRA